MILDAHLSIFFFSIYLILYDIIIIVNISVVPIGKPRHLYPCIRCGLHLDLLLFRHLGGSIRRLISFNLFNIMISELNTNSSNDQSYHFFWLFSLNYDLGIISQFLKRSYHSTSLFRNTSCRRRWLIHPSILSWSWRDQSKNQFISRSLCYRRT